MGLPDTPKSNKRDGRHCTHTPDHPFQRLNIKQRTAKRLEESTHFYYIQERCEILLKQMESLVREEIIQHMKINITSSAKKQFGFPPGRSTVLQLLIVLDIWTDILENRGGIEVVYCDFKKAFDKVPHQQLLKR